jgi:hypothetical protein
MVSLCNAALSMIQAKDRDLSDESPSKQDIMLLALYKGL